MQFAFAFAFAPQAQKTDMKITPRFDAFLQHTAVHFSCTNQESVMTHSRFVPLAVALTAAIALTACNTAP
ncbi:MAG: hypothetical protein ABI642_11050, partial [Polaromonas sp.]